MSSENKAQALAQHLEIDVQDITETGYYDDNEFEADGGEYLVLTDDEADDMWDERLEDYIDECILHELPEQYQSYFDRESWKRDARHDGRGHTLNHYGGSEDEEQVDGEWFFIYRTN